MSTALFQATTPEALAVARRFNELPTEGPITRAQFSAFLEQRMDPVSYRFDPFWKDARKLLERLPRAEICDAALEMDDKSPIGLLPSVRPLEWALTHARALPAGERARILEEIRFRAPMETRIKDLAEQWLQRSIH